MEKERIIFKNVDTNEDVEFLVIDRLEVSSQLYLLVIEADKEEDEGAECYILKATAEEDEDINFEILDDDSEVGLIIGLFNDKLDEFEID